MRTVSFVLPALNEEANIPTVLSLIPHEALASQGWRSEVVVVDNGSTDATATLAKAYGASVVHQPERGYGRAYQAGFAAAAGDVIVTGDTDCTYPLDHAPNLVEALEESNVDFLSTNRLLAANRGAMSMSHRLANRLLTTVSRALMPSPFCDSQSGMWVFRTAILNHLRLNEPGMAFSQELKNEAFLRGFRCAEVEIEYRTRGGDVKLQAWSDGVKNLTQLARHRIGHGSGRPRTMQECPALPARPLARPHVVDLRDVDLRERVNTAQTAHAPE
ncbi:MAG: glycosyltransferase family 2 protein [Actinomycetales bacterium]